MARLVYSSGPDGGDRRGANGCPRCGSRPCACPGERRLSPAEHSIVVRRERSGRRGKTVTVAGPFHLSDDDAAGLLKRLKRSCGCGGTLKREAGTAGRGGRSLEIQGDQVSRIADHLAALGYRVKRSGQ